LATFSEFTDSYSEIKQILRIHSRILFSLTTFFRIQNNMKIALLEENILTYLVQEHHHGLTLCQNIHQGFRKNIEPERIKKYCIWFFKQNIEIHFKIEEQYIFPILGKDHILVKKALREHRKIKRLIEDRTDIIKSINLLEELIEAHIRFEEKNIFNDIQKKVTQEIKNAILNDTDFHTTKITSEWHDAFWQ